MRNIFGQPVNKIHPRKIMDEKKIFIVNLAKGAIGDDAARIIGALLIAQFFSASLTRRDIPEEERVDFSLVVDEFPSFSTTVIANILSESRKYRLNVVLANQFLGQLDEQTEQAIFGNPGAVISFRVGETDGALLSKHFGGDYQPKHFSGLDNYTVCVKQQVKGISQDPFLGFTHLFEAPEYLGERKVRYLEEANIIRQSRRHYAERKSVVNAKIERWMTKELPSTSEKGRSRRRAMDDEIRRHAAARSRKGRRPTSGSGFAHIGDLFRRK